MAAAFNDEPFQSLCKRFKWLETELNTMQIDYQRVYTYHGQECILSFRVSMANLFEVISCVNKADKAFVDWHRRSKLLKGALRLVGMDRRTHDLIKKQSQKLKKKVSVVERQCSEANVTFGNGVEATTRLRQEFVSFSVNSVGEVSKAAIQTRDVYEADREQAQSKITAQEIGHQDVSAEATNTQEALTQLRGRSLQAETTRDVCTVSSYGSFGLAAVSVAASYLFTPSLALTAPLAILGGGSASFAMSYGQEVSRLELQQAALNGQLANQKSSIEALKNEISSLNLEHQRYTDTLQMIEELQDKTSIFRAEVQKTLDRLLQAKMILSRILTELEAIKDQLEECQFAKTRRDIARKLREIVESMQFVSGNEMLASDRQKVMEAMHALLKMNQKTEEVVEITSLGPSNFS